MKINKNVGSKKKLRKLLFQMRQEDRENHRKSLAIDKKMAKAFGRRYNPSEPVAASE